MGVSHVKNWLDLLEILNSAQMTIPELKKASFEDNLQYVFLVLLGLAQLNKCKTNFFQVRLDLNFRKLGARNHCQAPHRE